MSEELPGFWILIAIGLVVPIPLTACALMALLSWILSSL